MRSAEELWIKSIQSQSFPEEVNRVVSKKNTSVPVLVRQFGLYMDDKCLMRCRGRIQNSSLNQEEKTLMLLPSKHHIVDLILREAHERMLTTLRMLLENTRETNR